MAACLYHWKSVMVLTLDCAIQNMLHVVVCTDVLDDFDRGGQCVTALCVLISDQAGRQLARVVHKNIVRMDRVVTGRLMTCIMFG